MSFGLKDAQYDGWHRPIGLNAEDYASASQCAEEMGDYSTALEYHERLMEEVGLTYSNCLRAGWLHFRAGGYQRALYFYKVAAARLPDACEPVLGALDCCVAMGDLDAASEYIGSIPFAEPEGDKLRKVHQNSVI